MIIIFLKAIGWLPEWFPVFGPWWLQVVADFVDAFLCLVV